MEVRFADNTLQDLEGDPAAMGGFPPGISKVFRRRLQLIRAASDEKDFYNLYSLHYKKLKGKRNHQYSMWINDQYRLILEYEERSSEKIVVVIGIEDYH